MEFKQEHYKRKTMAQLKKNINFLTMFSYYQVACCSVYNWKHFDLYPCCHNLKVVCPLNNDPLTLEYVISAMHLNQSENL